MIDLHRYRKLASRLLEHATQGASTIHTDRYREITESRRYDLCRPPSSSCADLAHWMLYRLGVRLLWLNRAEHLGWRVGVNVSRLVTHASYWVGQRILAGDILIISSHPRGYDAHVLCVVAVHDDGNISTAEYGQPHGALRTRRIVDGGIGSRELKWVLSLEDVLIEADESGLLDIELEPWVDRL